MVFGSAYFFVAGCVNPPPPASLRPMCGDFTQPFRNNFGLHGNFYSTDRIGHPGLQRGAGAARVGRAARDLPGQRRRLLLQPRQAVALRLRGLPRRRQTQGARILKAGITFW